ncbi:hypothetical protein HDV06_006063 [Boothiomyces sp. JEL0866]|nr:hypothetical protein HDV06_006013 [Boothiomyces sp. JEL0866]KAJ3324805.1 hypothetical protein HDV06_006063 [Boothiomyces sp. JEL0866]
MATKDDWTFLIEQEEGELFVLQLIEDIIADSQKVLFKKHIDVQLLPYAVNFAKTSILSMINYHFFTRDPGDNDPSLWIPDTDSWARAAVPIKPLAAHYTRTTEKDPESIIKEYLLYNGRIVLPISKTKKAEAKKKPKQEISLVKPKPAPKLKPHPPKVKPGTRFSEPKIPRTVESANSEVERVIADENKRLLARINEKEDSKVDVTFDQSGRLLLVNNMPNWNGNSGVKIRILGSEKPKEDVKEPQNSVVKRGVVRKQKQKSVIVAQTNTDVLNDGFQDDPTLNIPLLADTMKIAPGVTLKEGDSVRARAVKVIEFLLQKEATQPMYPGISKEKDLFKSTQIAVLEEIINNSKPIPSQNSILLEKGR